LERSGLGAAHNCVGYFLHKVSKGTKAGSALLSWGVLLFFV
jgi:hypothetical protein